MPGLHRKALQEAHWNRSLRAFSWALSHPFFSLLQEFRSKLDLFFLSRSCLVWKNIHWRAFVILNCCLFYAKESRDRDHHYKTNPWQHQQYPSCCSSILEHSYLFLSPSLKHFIMLIIIMTILILELILLPAKWSP